MEIKKIKKTFISRQNSLDLFEGLGCFNITVNLNSVSHIK